MQIAPTKFFQTIGIDLFEEIANYLPFQSIINLGVSCKNCWKLSKDTRIQQIFLNRLPTQWTEERIFEDPTELNIHNISSLSSTGKYLVFNQKTADRNAKVLLIYSDDYKLHYKVSLSGSLYSHKDNKLIFSTDDTQLNFVNLDTKKEKTVNISEKIHLLSNICDQKIATATKSGNINIFNIDNKTLVKTISLDNVKIERRLWIFKNRVIFTMLCKGKLHIKAVDITTEKDAWELKKPVYRNTVASFNEKLMLIQSTPKRSLWFGSPEKGNQYLLTVNVETGKTHQKEFKDDLIHFLNKKTSRIITYKHDHLEILGEDLELKYKFTHPPKFAYPWKCHNVWSKNALLVSSKKQRFDEDGKICYYGTRVCDPLKQTMSETLIDFKDAIIFKNDVVGVEDDKIIVYKAISEKKRSTSPIPFILLALATIPLTLLLHKIRRFAKKP